MPEQQVFLPLLLGAAGPQRLELSEASILGEAHCTVVTLTWYVRQSTRRTGLISGDDFQTNVDS